MLLLDSVRAACTLTCNKCEWGPACENIKAKQCVVLVASTCQPGVSQGDCQVNKSAALVAQYIISAFHEDSTRFGVAAAHLQTHTCNTKSRSIQSAAAQAHQARKHFLCQLVVDGLAVGLAQQGPRQCQITPVRACTCSCQRRGSGAHRLVLLPLTHCHKSRATCQAAGSCKCATQATDDCLATKQ